MSNHFIVVGCIDFGEGTALISCGKNKALADELAAELNALVQLRKSQQQNKPCPIDLFEEWKRKRNFMHLKETILTDKYQVHEVITI